MTSESPEAVPMATFLYFPFSSFFGEPSYSSVITSVSKAKSWCAFCVASQRLDTVSQAVLVFQHGANISAGCAAVSALGGLSRRERQIMEILYQRGKLSASEVREAMEDAPSYSAVRALLRVLEDKGHVRHQAEGLRYVYLPTLARDKAKRAAVKHVLDTFFNGSPEQIVAALLDVSAPALTREELDRMAEMIEKARKEGR